MKIRKYSKQISYGSFWSLKLSKQIMGHVELKNGTVPSLTALLGTHLENVNVQAKKKGREKENLAMPAYLKHDSGEDLRP